MAPLSWSSGRDASLTPRGSSRRLQSHLYEGTTQIQKLIIGRSTTGIDAID